LNQPLSSELYSLLNKINNTKIKIVSIDMPSGIFTDTGQMGSIAVKASTTLTFHRLKPGLLLLPGKEYAGQIEILDIQLANLDNETNMLLLAPPTIKKARISDNKFNRGTTFIVAGRKLIGASKLAALAASQASLRAGAGLSKIFVHEGEENFFRPHILEEMLIIYKNLNHLMKIIQNTHISCLVYGCGIDITSQNKEFLHFLLQQKFDVVLDASVFSLMTENKEIFFESLKNRKAETVLTPHRGEFKRVFHCSDDKIKDSLQASKQTNSIILYKGNDTVITSPEEEIYINNVSSPFLATAGSGDVLAGIIGGFLAQGYSGMESVKIACYIHSQCGVQLKHGLVASDLVKEIPNILKKIN